FTSIRARSGDTTSEAASAACTTVGGGTAGLVTGVATLSRAAVEAPGEEASAGTVVGVAVARSPGAVEPDPPPHGRSHKTAPRTRTAGAPPAHMPMRRRRTSTAVTVT